MCVVGSNPSNSLVIYRDRTRIRAAMLRVSGVVIGWLQLLYDQCAAAEEVCMWRVCKNPKNPSSSLPPSLP